MTKSPALTGTMFTCALLGVAFTALVFAQSTEWKEYTSEKGKFSVLLPGDPPEIMYSFGNEGTDLGVHYVTSYQKDAKVWNVRYFDLLAIPKDAVAVKKLLEQERDSYTKRPRKEKFQTLNGYPTLEFTDAIDDGSRGRVYRIILVKQRIYELWVRIQSDQFASEDVTKFFDSFVPLPLTDDEVAEAAKAARADKEKIRPRKLMVSSGVLDGHAVKKVQPLYSPEAKAAKVSGTVRIQILVSEEGNVIEAVVVEGPELLRESALAAARQWVFRPTELAGVPVKVAGILNFKFALR